MSDSRVIQAIDTIRQRVVQAGQGMNGRTHGWSGVVASAISEVLKPATSIQSAAIAYFSLFSLFPILLLSISIASYNLVPWLNLQAILRLFEFIAPALDQLLGENIINIIDKRGPVTGVALVGLIWSGSSIFITLTQTLSANWGQKRGRPGWKRRGIAILFVLAIAGPLLLLASIASSVLDTFSGWLPAGLTFLAPGFRLAITILLDIALLMVMYLLLPHGSATWHELLPGATAAGLLWEVAKKGFLLFVSTYVTTSNLVYGSVTAIVAFLTWAYLSGYIFLFGAFMSCAYQDMKRSREEEKITIKDKK